MKVEDKMVIPERSKNVAPETLKIWAAGVARDVIFMEDIARR